MGHDTYLYGLKELAYHRRGFIATDKHKIYFVLNCEEFNSGVSGNGEYKLFVYDIDLYDRLWNRYMSTIADLEEDTKEFLNEFFREFKKEQTLILYFG